MSGDGSERGKGKVKDTVKSEESAAPAAGARAAGVRAAGVRAAAMAAVAATLGGVAEHEGGRGGGGDECKRKGKVVKACAENQGEGGGSGAGVGAGAAGAGASAGASAGAWKGGLTRLQDG